MIEAFNAICGGYRKPGDAVPNPGVFVPAPSVFSVIPANRTWESEPKAVSDSDIGQLYGEFPSGIIPDEITADSPDRIRALVAIGGNPVQALGHPEKTIPAFKSLELLVALDPRMTDTAKLAHYIVPPALPYERYDCTVVGDYAYHQPFAQMTEPVLTPPPGVLPEWEFLWGVSKRLGYQLELKLPIFGASFASMPDGYKLDMKNKPEAEKLIKEIVKQTPVDYDALKSNPSGITPDIEPVIVAEPEEDDGARLSLMPEDVAAELTAELEQRPKNSEFPLVLSTRRILDAMNGSFRDAARTRKRFPTNPLFMHPDDIAACKLEDGQTALVESKFGKVTAVTKKDPSMKPGVIAIPHMWGSSLTDSINDPLGTHTGRLISLDEGVQTINHMPRFSGVEVKVSAI